ncbi:transposase, IS605 family [Paenibacillus larvae subsp. larvae]|uniref:Transposase, IS605 family n=1 Tax=Paenibacillus larvae subsp. larvae TaxID=147375 RepID=A0A2L1UAQ7_9BACL|nr:transposase, IS605 family [Paenibacillus larvae subsp. larvae]AVF30002.1 transposase, IS605 family [Paenibacillus larvae subsp. larvae]MBH0344530.1 transposase [Paenibacillus larvae]
MANKSYKFRFYPTQEQLLAKTFGCVLIYNKMLAEQKETYEKFKDDKRVSFLSQ